MWKKTGPGDAATPASDASSPTIPHPAHIGGSLSIKGDLYGEEDLFIEGEIEGNITVKKGSVTVGESGRVRADIQAANIQIAGEVTGDLASSNQVVLLETGRVEGNIKAGSVTLQNGARFKGSIDMESDGKKQPAHRSADASRAANGPSRPSTRERA